MPHRAGYGKSRRWWLYRITFKCLPYRMTWQSDFNRESYATHFKGNSRICCT